MSDSASIRIMLADVRPLDQDELFAEGIERMSDYRQEKILRYHFRRDQNLSLGAGMALDSLLSSYGLYEKEMSYVEDVYGKPRFRDYPDIHFNLSHAGDYAVCITGPVEIGVDIEPDRLVDWEIVHQNFHRGELDYLRSLPEEELSDAFTRLWTLKESFLKALGTGLLKSLSDFEIVLDKTPYISDSKYHGFSFREFGWTGYKVALCVCPTGITIDPAIEHYFF